MASPFNLENQNKKIENKIVVALERISEAYRVLLWQESKENNLSPIQIQIIIFLLYHFEEKCKVNYLAQEFNMTKATISDSIKSLLQKAYIEKIEDPHDNRSFTIHLTKEGKIIAKKSALFTQSFDKPLTSLNNFQKEQMLDGLLHLISHLNKIGVISIQRMCFTCSHYQRKNDFHYCSLLKSKLATHELRVDCNEHVLSH